VIGWLRNAIPISSAVKIAEVAFRFGNFMAPRPQQELFPHFGEAGKAVLAVQQVEYGGHEIEPR